MGRTATLGISEACRRQPFSGCGGRIQKNRCSATIFVNINAKESFPIFEAPFEVRRDYWLRDPTGTSYRVTDEGIPHVQRS